MQAFHHVVAPLRIFHGPDSFALLPRELDRLGCRRAVIVCGSSLARHGTALDLIRAALGERCAGVFADHAEDEVTQPQNGLRRHG